jgi:hypothetical protein
MDLTFELKKKKTMISTPLEVYLKSITSPRLEVGQTVHHEGYTWNGK